MEYLTQNIAVNLKRIRAAKRLSLDEVSEQTGVSKSMLGQIERSGSNPTISTLAKIVSGLRVTLDDLIKEPPLEKLYVSKEKLVPTKEEPGQYRVYSYFPYEKNRNFELYMIDVWPGGSYVSGSHGEKTSEYITAVKGEMTIQVDKEQYTVKEGDGFRFDTDREHSYINLGTQVASIVCVFQF